MARRECLNHGEIVDIDEPYRRGMCAACYQSAHRAVQLKLITWDQLVKKGIAAPAEKGGRPRKRPENTPLDRLIAESISSAESATKDAAKKRPTAPGTGEQIKDRAAAKRGRAGRGERET